MLSTALIELAQQAQALEAENRSLRLQVKRLEGKVRQLERQEQASTEPEPWRVLGIQPTASAEQVQAAFRELAKEHHPDLGGDPLRFQQLKAARDAMLEAVQP